ncbi:hypothetical protein ACGFI9_32315 [Micromonospora sp. NPDC048930]|uniref:hypothetical protein n=1 Tax=Micromonospora sp. NPDC048930 TaxID=3364261 RepID=UPI003723C054
MHRAGAKLRRSAARAGGQRDLQAVAITDRYAAAEAVALALQASLDLLASPTSRCTPRESSRRQSTQS